MADARTGAWIEIRWIGLTADGQLDLSNLDQLLDGAKVFVVHRDEQRARHDPPDAQLCAAAHAAGALAVVDACQYVPHNVTDVQAWGADLVAFSSHKMCGPTGIGMLWGKMEILDAMPPFLGGGNMIDDRHLRRVHHRTGSGEVRGRHPADRRSGRTRCRGRVPRGLGMDNIRQHEMQLTRYALDTLNDRFGDEHHDLRTRQRRERGGVFSFAFRDLHPHDVSQVLDETQRVRTRRPPLRQAADEDARRQRHHPREPVPLQRRSRHRCAGRRPRRRQRYLRLLMTDTVTSRSVMPGLEDLYREIILDHYRTPRNRGELDTPPATKVDGHNPLCGDEITVYLDVDGTATTPSSPTSRSAARAARSPSPRRR